MQKGVLNREHPFFTKESDELTMQNLPERLFFKKKQATAFACLKKVVSLHRQTKRHWAMV